MASKNIFKSKRTVTKLEISNPKMYPLLDIRIKDTFLHVDPLGLQKLYFNIVCCKIILMCQIKNENAICNLINYIYNVIEILLITLQKCG